MNSFHAVAFAILVALLVAAWGVGTLAYRERPWSIAGWIPLTGLAGAGSLMFATMLFGSCSRSRGAEGAFAAIGAADGMVLLIPCPLFLGLSVYVRPRGPHSQWAILSSSLVLLASLWFLRTIANTL
ncbi:MAG: hypothetical protein U1G08_10150 [Verrucomicrobiota bacterium]